MSVTVSIVGLDKLVAQFNAMGTDAMRLCNATIAANVADMVVEAKQSAPSDLGKIRQNLGSEDLSTSDAVIYNFFSNAPESPFQEFGTGGKVDVPTEMADVASQFQGASGGSMADFILALTDWVRRHGLTGIYSISSHKRIGSKASNTDADTQAAWAIAKTILRDGLTPRPFFYPAYVNGKAKLIPQLEAALNQLVSAA